MNIMMIPSAYHMEEMHKKGYDDWLRNLKPGIHELIIHPSFMSEEYEQYVWHPYVLTGDHAYWSSSETKALAGQHLGTGPKQINLESTLAELNINDKPNPLTPLQQQAKVLHLIKGRKGDVGKEGRRW